MDGGVECWETDFVGGDVSFVPKQRTGVDDAAANLEHAPFALLLRVRQNVAFRISAAEQQRHSKFDERFERGLARLLRATVEPLIVEQPAIRADLESVFEEGALDGQQLKRTSRLRIKKHCLDELDRMRAPVGERPRV